MVFCGEWQIKEYQLAGACELRGCECPAMLDRVAASGIVRLLGEEALLQEQNAQERCALVGPSGRVDRGWDGLSLPSGMDSHGRQRHHVTLGRGVRRQSHRITLTASILHGFAEETVFCMELQMV